mgnify:CR=1 FL=1
MARASKTTYTFSVTFEAPKGMNIPTARSLIKEALISIGALELSAPEDLKVHLTNKEVKYG